MEIDGNKAYLSISEQRRSELDSPIELINENILPELFKTVDEYYELINVINSDIQDNLPRQRAEAISRLDRTVVRRELLFKISEYMLLNGLSGVENIEKLH